MHGRLKFLLNIDASIAVAFSPPSLPDPPLPVTFLPSTEGTPCCATPASLPGSTRRCYVHEQGYARVSSPVTRDHVGRQYLVSRRGHHWVGLS